MGIKDMIHITKKFVTPNNGPSVRKMSKEERRAITDELERMKRETEMRNENERKLASDARLKAIKLQDASHQREIEDRKHREEEDIRNRRLKLDDEKRRIELEKLEDEETALNREKERIEKERSEQQKREELVRREEEARAEREQHRIEAEQRKQFDEQRFKEEERIQLEKSKTEKIIADNNSNLELCKKVIGRLATEISPLQRDYDTLNSSLSALQDELTVKFPPTEENDGDRIQKQAKNRLFKKVEITERKLDTITLKLNTLKSELNATYEMKRKCDDIESQYRTNNTRTVTIPYPFFVSIDDLNRKTLTIYTDSLDNHTESVLETIQNAFHVIDIQPTPLESGTSDDVKTDNISICEFDKKFPTCTISPSCAGDNECEICLSPLCKNTLCVNIGNGGNIKTLGCGHIFHAECVTPWVTQYTSSCPSCRKEV